MENSIGIEKFLNHINDPELIAILNIQNVLLQELQNYAVNNGFKQLMPLLISPFTDPLNHQVYPATIKYGDKMLSLTSSMIFHKQLSLIPKNINKVFILSPNIRLELEHKQKTGNHMLEFSQFDFEIKNASMNDVMKYIEGLYIYIFDIIQKRCSEELKILNRQLPKLQKPFPVYSTTEIPLDEVDDYCTKLSKELNSPFFVTNLKREFYDREDPDRPKTYRNFDMFYPEGYEEALSGGEREYIYDDIIRRIAENDTDKKPLENYLKIAKMGLLNKSAGAGIGVQRLLKFICGKRKIEDVCMFNRSVGTNFDV
ncbi:asparagine synthetase A [Clostridium felsineum]|uniref:Asparagine--tRNA ligase n=1 Tax=Clostridium felsineum TaxID=36839 RepID=A0A1S8LWW6_9CLOT|nr:asparagine synthetase A [Clostridium felsineum]MCR3761611.1 asparagine synthetase A [Clostridium felsineum]URZ08334.1 Asparagine--tRNA ligase [Clostridium felsineum]URZ13365.1 Asparagine--tRNA ligase [Clostridium felsineum]